MKKTSICSTILVIACFAASLVSGATVPAGATLIAQTLQTISSQDVPGTRFQAQLGSDVVAKGKVVLRAGTKLSGKVVTSRRIYTSTQRLTVDITEAIVDGRALPIKTTGAVQLDNTKFKTRNDVPVSRASYSVAAGRIIQFRLAQPIRL